MKVKLLLIFLLAIFLIFSCQKENSTEPENENIHPQQDIAWPSLADSPWPMFHHDPQSTGRSPYVGPRKGKIKWTFTPNGTIYSAVVIGPDSIIYFPFSDGAEYLTGLYALYPSGKMKWKIQIPLESDTQPLIAADGTIFLIGISSFEGAAKRCLYAINADGTIKNKFIFDFEPYTRLNIGIDGTIFLTDESHLYAVNQQGDVLWSLSASHEFGSYNFALSPDGNTIYLFDYISYHQISAICAVGIDGHLKWNFPVEGDQHAAHSPLIDSDGNVYFGTFGISESCGFYVLSPNGKLTWQYPGTFEGETVINDNGQLFSLSVSANSILISFDYSGNLLWQKESEPFIAPFICDKDGIVYICSAKNVYAYNGDGEPLWQVPFDNDAVQIACPAIGYNGTLYVGTLSSPMEKSKLYAIE